MPGREHADRLANRLAAAAHAVPARVRRAPVQLERAVARPDLASPQDVTRLQQQYGNRAVQRWLAHHAVQAQLTVGPASDPYEREADRVAEQVAERLGSPSGAGNVQRGLADEARLQRQPLAAAITPLGAAPQRKGLDDDDLRRMAETTAASQAGGPVSQAASAGIEQARGGGQRLPESVRRPMEAAFGADFGRVKIHTDARADRLNRSLSARAFTTGRDVFFRRGEFDPASRPGQKLLAHELTHVVQQGGAAATLRRAPADEARPEPAPTNEPEPDLRDGLSGRRVDRLRPGDLLLPRTGRELPADLTQYGRFLQRLWRGQARGTSGFPVAGLALSPSLMALGQGNGVSKQPIAGHFFVFRCSNRALAELAAAAAGNWSVFENSANGVDHKYSLPRHFDALAHSSRFNRQRAVNLAAFFLHGASVNHLLTADFAIMCYQAAAMLEDVEDLKAANPPPAPETDADGPGRRRTGLDALPPGALELDPRRLRPFQFAAELHRLAQGDSPSWDLAGVY